MTAWSLDTRFCASPLQQPFVPGSPTSSLSSHNSDESSSSQGSVASSQTSTSSSNSWRDEFDSSQTSGKSCAKFDAAAFARQRSHADYRKSCLKISSRCEDSWPTDSGVHCPAPNSTGLVHPRRSIFCPARAKPNLVRQSDRREDFVEYLVDTATQMVAVIWPNSATSLSNGVSEVKKEVLPLRIFIKETLRRSRTSYSTLQVAMYYLILIKSKARLPKCDFPDDKPLDRTQCRVMHCGRRMFLAALILASKYLQDRNYSARAWSKISGLKIHEINSNELSFLAAVEWKLHISEETFLRWTDIVTTYTNSMHNFGPRAGLTRSITSSWTSLVKRLTPALEFTQTTWARPPAIHRPGPEFDISQDRPTTSLSLHTPKSIPARPSVLEARKNETQFRIPPTPLLNSRLTTPVSTPSSTTANTPMQVWTRSPATSSSLRATQPELHAAFNRTTRESSQTTLSEPNFEQICSTPLKNETTPSNPVSDIKISRDSGVQDSGLVSLLEAAKELGWSGDESDDEIIKETPLSSPASDLHSSTRLPPTESACIQSPSSSCDMQFSDEDDGLPTRNESNTAIKCDPCCSISASTPATTRRKRRLNSLIDLPTTRVLLPNRAPGHRSLSAVTSSSSDDVVMHDRLEVDILNTGFRGRRDVLPPRLTGMDDQASGLLSHDRVPVQRSLSGRKRVCCA